MAQESIKSVVHKVGDWGQSKGGGHACPWVQGRARRAKHTTSNCPTSNAHEDAEAANRWHVWACAGHRCCHCCMCLCIQDRCAGSMHLHVCHAAYQLACRHEPHAAHTCTMCLRACCVHATCLPHHCCPSSLPLPPPPTQVCDTVSDLAGSIYEEPGWPELMPTLQVRGCVCVGGGACCCIHAEGGHCSGVWQAGRQRTSCMCMYMWVWL